MKTYTIIAKCNGNMIEGGKKSIELIDDCLKKRMDVPILWSTTEQAAIADK